MSYLPIFLELEDERVLLIGGGRVAWRRAEQLLAARARLTVIAPQIRAEFRRAEPAKNIELLERAVHLDDLTDAYRLVVVASSDGKANRMLGDACRARKIWCCRSDDFAAGSAVWGSIQRAEPLVGAVMASGVPEVAKYCRQKIGELFRPGLVELTRLLAELRPELKAAAPDQVRELFASLVNEATIERIEREGSAKLRQEIMTCL